MVNKSVLSVRNLSKVYKGVGHEVQALKDVSFELYEGELIAIMGTSGSGKSTLLNVLAALDEPDKGEIQLYGQKQTEMFTEPNATYYRRDKIGFIFQAFHLLKDLTVEENIALPLILKGEKKSYIDEKVDEMLQFVGLLGWRKQRPVQLSGGQQQRVAIGRALITAPPIVLADELTGNLDYNTSNEILQVLVKMKETLNQAIIVVTHDPHVAAFADRVLFFHDGQIVNEYDCSGNQAMDDILEHFGKLLEFKV
ncbi:MULTISPECIES: ABC transporter ATP-binding protein [unclassified Niallia]|uniref:ABC transporter ATP-binding protein n=1 Tax=unclassified Niallia TaxID=2837522 RepID=UPI001EDADF17|nr:MULTISPECIES: ABC transporter ATP-binding protein [unclassified Niallia]MDL0437536.1 ABC transporter ATP-binding protein [Niallia sp. SS-2023]UPO87971.1 ABC transporter ATP-binding protein [Niallia sp. Man26]